MPMPKPILINTRPSHRAGAIGQLSDLCVLDLPLLTICDLPIGTAEQQMMLDWQAGHYQLLIITSVEAARRALLFLKNTDLSTLPTTPIIAVGDATADVLTQAGLTATTPAIANNEGMLAMPVVRSLQAKDKVLIWRGIGGRRLMHDTLVKKGVMVDACEWYKRDRPDDLTANFAKLQPKLDGTPFVLISSQMALEHWQTLPHTHDYHYLALGDRLTKLTKQVYPTSLVSCIANLDPKTIASSIAKMAV